MIHSMPDTDYFDLQRGYSENKRAIGEPGTFMDQERGGKKLQFGGDQSGLREWYQQK